MVLLGKSITNSVYVGLLMLCFLSNVDAFCGQVSTFNLLCQNGTVTYILSASPCQDKNFISITILNTNSGNITRVLTDKNIDEPIPVDDEPGKGIILDLHPKYASEYRKETLHVLVHHVDITEFKTKFLLGYNLFSHHFYMFREECDDSVMQAYDTGFTSIATCDYSLRLSEFSTLCSFKNQKNKIELGSYILFLDPCTVPISATLMFISKEKFSQIQFTSNYSDGFYVIGNNDKCGIKLMLMDKTEDIYYAKLYYGCEDDSNSLTMLINDEYHHEMGFICPLLECKQISNVEQVCTQPWIIKNNKTQIARTRLKLDICQDVVQANFSVYLMTSSNIYPWEQYMLLKADHELEMNEFGYAVKFLLSTRFHPLLGNKGYLDISGGNVSLYVAEFPDDNPEDNVIHTVVVRHYPNYYNFLPILHNEFHVNRKDVCETKKGGVTSSDSSLKVAIPIVIVALILFVVIVFILWWRRKQQRVPPGLPYQIHMSGSELDDDFAY